MTDLKIDARVQRTRELLLDALVQLLMERGYEKLTIQNLLDRARVGRSTFYAHFQSKDELLACSIERLRVSLTTQWRTAVNAKNSTTERLTFTLPFFQHLDSHRRIYHTTIGREHERSIELHMQRMLKALVREDLELQRVRATAAAVDLATRYVVGTLWAVVVWWMDGNQSLAPEDVNRTFQRMTFPGLEAIIGAGP
jgi:AcrR family transcriptional regulator